MATPDSEALDNAAAAAAAAADADLQGHTVYWTQADALFRKNLTYQKRNWKTNCCLVCFPLVICIILISIQAAINNLLGSQYECGCQCVFNASAGGCTEVCGLLYSNQDQAPFCAVANPQQWPAVLQVPKSQFRAIQTTTFPDLLGDTTCRADNACPTSILYTGSNKTTADSMASYLLSTGVVNPSDPMYTFASLVLGSDTTPGGTLFVESAFTSGPVEVIQRDCSGPWKIGGSLTLNVSGLLITEDFTCVEAQTIWRSAPSSINNELYAGFRKGNSLHQINEFPVAYDFASTNATSFDVNVWYNGTMNHQTLQKPPNLIRVARSLNMASKSFLSFKAGRLAQLPLLFVKEMPKPSSKLRFDFSSLLGPLFYMWILGFLFPVVLISLVYEKEYHLRMMMKMHGLGDVPYWTITYFYFVVLFTVYMFFFIFFGSVVGLKFFLLNSYSLQFVFYILYVNMVIALGFLVSNVFVSARTATVVGYLYVFGSGLLGSFFFQNFVVDLNTSRKLVLFLELFPPFVSYRGLYEFAQYSFQGVYTNSKGMQWSDLSDPKNGMRQVLVILFLEWIFFMVVTIYLDQVAMSESGINKHPLFFLNFKRMAKSSGAVNSSHHLSASSQSLPEIHLDDEQGLSNRPDVTREIELVEELSVNPDGTYPIVCNNLKRIYPAKDGNPPKYAVRGFTLAVPRGECFGILGPNGAGKTSSINMMIGFLKPTSGTAYVQGMNIQTDMDRIYSCMGVCPQHDLLWGQLTGREHLLFYGRLKNLKGAALFAAVESSLRSVNLFDNGVADKQCQRYSGGMKRRLSVAISLIGNPQVVYMDEPSTGLDPASRYNLWSVVKQSKANRAIILTTHSMEEAEALCDRLGIFVNGELQCIGNAKELIARFGGLYVLTITTPREEEAEVMALANCLTPNAKKVYGLSGTQKFELPKVEVKVADVFIAVEQAKKYLHIHAWGLSDTTLEDVFIKIARQSNGRATLS